MACHHYLARRGPADLVFERDVALLERHGHVVIRLTFDNRDVRRRSRLGLVRDAIWNREFCGRLRELVRCRAAGGRSLPQHVPADFAGGLLRRKGGGRGGRAVTSRIGPVLSDRHLPTIHHACFRRPAAVARVAATVLAVHRAIGTYRRAVDCYSATNATRPRRIRRDWAARGADRCRVHRTGIRAAEADLRNGHLPTRKNCRPMRRRSRITRRIDPAGLRRRAIAARWRPEFTPTETWVPMASNLAIVRADAPLRLPGEGRLIWCHADGKYGAKTAQPPLFRQQFRALRGIYKCLSDLQLSPEFAASGFTR